MRHGLILGACAALACAAHADVLHDESIHGDLSGDRFNPTALLPSLGDNSIIGETVRGDLEYFTVHIAAGRALGAIFVDGFTSTDDLAFIAVQEGTTFTEPPESPDVTNLLGWWHLGIGDLGTDILDDIGTGDGAIGFIPPLPAGDYTFWLQQTGMEPVGYDLNFVVIPAPASGLALAAILLSRRRR